ncbi:uncharacterized protein P884DRAFT_155964, partial [Thermothelomyces heterothallicus CBS 202.75]|uniref:uncharacterized protein n=1 Tax=Thermothelomyces heterothallicus CBS 202.75 TaxID=1149848 RepID=UPI003743AE44
MAGVQGMPFTASELPHSANKERAGFCWQGVPGAASTDIFDQYVELGDSDAESASGQSGGFGRLVQLDQLDQLDQLGFSELPSMTPHVSLDQIMAPGGGAQGGPEAHQSRPSELKRDQSPSPRVCQPSQDLHPLYRAQTDIALLNSVGDTPGGGSISDSELLNLEGLTMRSPRIQIPHLSTPEPASPPSGAASPRKVSRLGTLCTKIRNMTAALQGMNSETSVLPEDVQRVVAGSEPNLVNGYLRGSLNPSGLLNDQFVHLLQLNGGSMHQTPLSTAPIADGLRLPVSALDGKPLWTTPPGTYLDGGDGDDDANTWWDPSSDAMDTDVPAVSYHAAVNERSTSLNMGVQLHHRQSFEYPASPGTNDTTNTVTTTIFGSKGLMLHTPQPRGIPSAVLHSDVSAHRPTRADCHRHPRPRAPSLSARHHHHQHQYGPGVSPRKGGKAKGGGSVSASRIASASPSPRPPAFAPGPNGSLLHGRSASMLTLHYSCSAAGLSADGGTAIHKRKSWTGRRTSSSSSSLHHQYHGLAMTAAAAA